ncbi:hypothetical protein SJI19_13645 [Acerihabitans sp. TG2]|uniref:hypothetical protein n=1 Tax=Acerihabitans sp. TG2 TaxID=3096008 RepID=UPI002B22F479|nr:hypothetical protein [Acerihabitans sp. TG2]MEA9391573.1 hypothetical protein [Acerihabitans sp. TG2]
MPLCHKIMCANAESGEEKLLQGLATTELEALSPDVNHEVLQQVHYLHDGQNRSSATMLRNYINQLSCAREYKEI